MEEGFGVVESLFLGLKLSFSYWGLLGIEKNAMGRKYSRDDQNDCATAGKSAMASQAVAVVGCVRKKGPHHPTPGVGKKNGIKWDCKIPHCAIK